MSDDEKSVAVSLSDNASLFPDTLAKAITLPILVSDEGHKLYLDFVDQDHNRLQEYLGFVRVAQLAALQRNADPFALAEM